MESRVHRIEGSVEENEAWLQRYLAAHPDILPIQDLEGIESNLRLIARELSEIDLLFADERGLLTLIETKLYKNLESRRQVIAQVLDYAARLRDFSVPELCRQIVQTKGQQAVKEISGLAEFTDRLSKYLTPNYLNDGKDGGSDEETKEKLGRAILAHYVVSNRVSESPTLSFEERAFIKKLDLMLKDESFRLVSHRQSA